MIKITITKQDKEYKTLLNFFKKNIALIKTFKVPMKFIVNNNVKQLCLNTDKRVMYGYTDIINFVRSLKKGETKKSGFTVNPVIKKVKMQGESFDEEINEPSGNDLFYKRRKSLSEKLKDDTVISTTGGDYRIETGNFNNKRSDDADLDVLNHGGANLESKIQNFGGIELELNTSNNIDENLLSNLYSREAVIC
jgi:hypothetical protein